MGVKAPAGLDADVGLRRVEFFEWGKSRGQWKCHGPANTDFLLGGPDVWNSWGVGGGGASYPSA